MDSKKRNVQVESDGSRSAPVPLWQELPQITVRLKEGNTSTALLPVLTERTPFLKRR